MNEKRKPRFVRKDTKKILRLGRLRRKSRKWRRSRGRHAKIRKKRKGYLKAPSIGYGAAKKTKGLIAGAKPKLIFNVKQLEQVKTGEIAVIGKIGEKKKAEIAKAALKAKIKILNLKTEAFLKKLEKKAEAKKAKKEHAKKAAEKEKAKKETKKAEIKEEAPKKAEKEKAEKAKILKQTPEAAKPIITKITKKTAPEIKRKALEK